MTSRLHDDGIAPVPEPVWKRPRQARPTAPGAFRLDFRGGCFCCGSVWCGDSTKSTPASGSAWQNCRPEVLRLRNKVVADRRHFHQHPETAFQEYETSKYCAQRLRDLGLTVVDGVAPGTGVVAVLKGGGGEGPCIALRADMDALPIQEEAADGEEPLPFASTNPGVMHACGHDAHMATMLCVAEVLSTESFRSRLRGSVKFIFQPAEENGSEEHPQGGAFEMVHKARVLDDVDAIYGMHVWSFAPVGVVGVSPGCIMAACDSLEIDIEGRGGHGAAPQGTADAVLAMGHLITSLHSIVSRNQNPQSSTVLTIGSASGGEAPNVIASRAKLRATVRCLDSESQAIMKRRIEEVCHGVGATFNAKITLKYREEAPNVVNDEEAAQHVKKAAASIVSPDGLQNVTTMASEDFAFFLEASKNFPGVTVPGIQGCFFFVGAAPKTESVGNRPHHNPTFTVDEDSMLVGASVFVQLVENLLGSALQQ